MSAQIAESDAIAAALQPSPKRSGEQTQDPSGAQRPAASPEHGSTAVPGHASGPGGSGSAVAEESAYETTNPLPLKDASEVRRIFTAAATGVRRMNGPARGHPPEKSVAAQEHAPQCHVPRRHRHTSTTPHTAVPLACVQANINKCAL